MSEVNLNSGGKIIAGDNISTRQLPLAADTYFKGMRLEYKGAVAISQTGTGDGTLSAVIADESIKPGIYTLTATAALLFDLTDPDGNVLAQGLAIADGGARTFKVGGLTFTITDGSAAFVAADTLVATVTLGANEALTDGNLSAVYNGNDNDGAGRVLSSAGVDDCIVAGDIAHSGIVDDAGASVTLTEDEIALYRVAGFFVKEY